MFQQWQEQKAQNWHHSKKPHVKTNAWSERNTHVVPPVAIMLQAKWDSGHSLGTDCTEWSWMCGHTLFVIQTTNDGFRGEVAHGSCVCTGLVIFLRDKVFGWEAETDKEASKTKKPFQKFP